MLYQVDDVLPHAMSGSELWRVPTELRLLPYSRAREYVVPRGGHGVRGQARAVLRARAVRATLCTDLKSVLREVVELILR